MDVLNPPNENELATERELPKVPQRDYTDSMYSFQRPLPVQYRPPEPMPKDLSPTNQQTWEQISQPLPGEITPQEAQKYAVNTGEAMVQAPKSLSSNDFWYPDGYFNAMGWDRKAERQYYSSGGEVVPLGSINLGAGGYVTPVQNDMAQNGLVTRIGQENNTTPFSGILPLFGTELEVAKGVASGIIGLLTGKNPFQQAYQHGLKQAGEQWNSFLSHFPTDEVQNSQLREDEYARKYFDPKAGKFGDYGTGAVGAAFYLLNTIVPQGPLMGLIYDVADQLTGVAQREHRMFGSRVAEAFQGVDYGFANIASPKKYLSVVQPYDFYQSNLGPFWGRIAYTEAWLAGIALDMATGSGVDRIVSSAAGIASPKTINPYRKSVDVEPPYLKPPVPEEVVQAASTKVVAVPQMFEEGVLFKHKDIDFASVRPFLENSPEVKARYVVSLPTEVRAVDRPEILNGLFKADINLIDNGTALQNTNRSVLALSNDIEQLADNLEQLGINPRQSIADSVRTSEIHGVETPYIPVIPKVPDTIRYWREHGIPADIKTPIRFNELADDPAIQFMGDIRTFLDNPSAKNFTRLIDNSLFSGDWTEYGSEGERFLLNVLDYAAENLLTDENVQMALKLYHNVPQRKKSAIYDALQTLIEEVNKVDIDKGERITDPSNVLARLRNNPELTNLVYQNVNQFEEMSDYDKVRRIVLPSEAYKTTEPREYPATASDLMRRFGWSKVKANGLLDEMYQYGEIQPDVEIQPILKGLFQDRPDKPEWKPKRPTVEKLTQVFEDVYKKADNPAVGDLGVIAKAHAEGKNVKPVLDKIVAKLRYRGVDVPFIRTDRTQLPPIQKAVFIPNDFRQTPEWKELQNEINVLSAKYSENLKPTRQPDLSGLSEQSKEAFLELQQNPTAENLIKAFSDGVFTNGSLDDFALYYILKSIDDQKVQDYVRVNPDIGGSVIKNIAEYLKWNRYNYSREALVKHLALAEAPTKTLQKWIDADVELKGMMKSDPGVSKPSDFLNEPRVVSMMRDFGFTPKEAAALHNYIYGSAAFPNSEIATETARVLHENVGKALSTALLKLPVSDEKILYRGVKFYDIKSLEQFLEQYGKVGNNVELERVMATTPRMDTAQKFAGYQKTTGVFPVVITIENPHNGRALSAIDMTSAYENETLYPAGSRFVVKKVNTSNLDEYKRISDMYERFYHDPDVDMSFVSAVSRLEYEIPWPATKKEITQFFKDFLKDAFDNVDDVSEQLFSIIDKYGIIKKGKVNGEYDLVPIKNMTDSPVFITLEDVSPTVNELKKQVDDAIRQMPLNTKQVYIQPTDGGISLKEPVNPGKVVVGVPYKQDGLFQVVGGYLMPDGSAAFPSNTTFKFDVDSGIATADIPFTSKEPPQVVTMYHGTNAKFDYKKQPIDMSGYGELGSGLYLSDDPHLAQLYAGALHNQDRPLHVQNGTKQKVISFNVVSGLDNFIDGSKQFGSHAQDVIVETARQFGDDVLEAVQTTLSKGLPAKDFYSELRKVLPDESEQFLQTLQRTLSKALKENGYDGMYYNGIAAVYNFDALRTIGNWDLIGETIETAVPSKKMRLVADQMTSKKLDTDYTKANAIQSEISLKSQWLDELIEQGKNQQRQAIEAAQTITKLEDKAYEAVFSKPPVIQVGDDIGKRVALLGQRLKVSTNSAENGALNLALKRYENVARNALAESINPGVSESSLAYKLAYLFGVEKSGLGFGTGLSAPGKVRRRMRAAINTGEGTVYETVAQLESARKLNQAERISEQIRRRLKIAASDPKWQELKRGLVEVPMHKYIDAYGDIGPVGQHILQGRQERYAQFMRDLGIVGQDAETLVKAADEVAQAYHETLAIMKSLGVELEDLRQLRPLDRILSDEAISRMNWKLAGDKVRFADGSTETVANLFHKTLTVKGWAVEKSVLLDAFLKEKFGNDVYRMLSERTGVPMQNVHDLVTSEGYLLPVLVDPSIVSDTELSRLASNGILSSIEMTSPEIFRDLVKRFDLPFENLNEMFATNWQAGFRAYKAQLEKAAGEALVSWDTIRNAVEGGWGVHRSVVNTEAKYKKFVPLSSVIPESKFGIESARDAGLFKQFDDVYVHPVVAATYKSLLQLNSSPVQMGALGRLLGEVGLIFRTLAVSTREFIGRQLITQYIQTLAAGGNPFTLTGDVIKRLSMSITGRQALDNVHRVYSGPNGKLLTELELYSEAIKTRVLSPHTFFTGETIESPKYSSWNPLQVRKTARYLANTFSERGLGEAALEALGYTRKTISGVAGYPIRLANTEFENAARFNVLKNLTNRKNTVMRLLLGESDQLSYSQAVNRINEYFFEYDNVGEADRIIGRFVAPFWMWVSRNTVGQMQHVLRHPQKWYNYLKLQAAINAPMVNEDAPLGGTPAYLMDEPTLWWKTPDGEPFALPIAPIDPVADNLSNAEQNINSIMRMFGIWPEYTKPKSAQERVEDVPWSKTKTNRAINRWIRNTYGQYKVAASILSGTDVNTDRPIDWDKPAEVWGFEVHPLFKLLVDNFVPLVGYVNRMNPGNLFGRKRRYDARGNVIEPGFRSKTGGVERQYNDYEQPNVWWAHLLNTVGLKGRTVDFAANMSYTQNDIDKAIYDGTETLRSLIRQAPTIPADKQAEHMKKIQTTQAVLFALKIDQMAILKWQSERGLPSSRALSLIRQGDKILNEVPITEQERDRIIEEIRSIK